MEDNTSSDRNARMDRRSANNTIEETSQVSRMRDTNLLLSRRFDAAQDEVDRCHDQIARQAGSARALQSHCDVLTQQVASITQEVQQLRERERELLGDQAEKDLQHKYIIEKITAQIEQSEADSQSLMKANEQLKQKSYQLEAQVDDHMAQLSGFRSDAARKDQALDDLYMKKEGRGPSTYLLEIDQLKSDNRRLVSMLQQTKQYKEFQGFVADSGGQVRAIYSKDEQKQSRPRSRQQSRSGKGSRKQKQTSPNRGSPSIAQHRIVKGNLILVEDDQDGGDPQVQYRVKENEKATPVDDWVPEDAYKTAHQFRQEHGDDLSPSLVNMLLSDLNKIWREREKKQISRIKSSTTSELNDMKRKLSHRAPYDIVHCNKTISHLSARLQTLAKEVTAITGKQDKKKYSDLPAGLELIDHTLQLLAQMQQQKKSVERQNEEMQDRLRVYEDIKKDEIHDKNKFMEGAIWMGKRISAEVERTCQSFESMAQEYRKRFGEIEGKAALSGSQPTTSNRDSGLRQGLDLLSLQRAQVWFLESVKQLGFELYEQTITMLESALQLKDDAEARLGEGQDNYSPVRREDNEDQTDLSSPGKSNYRENLMTSNPYNQVRPVTNSHIPRHMGHMLDSAAFDTNDLSNI